MTRQRARTELETIRFPLVPSRAGDSREGGPVSHAITETWSGRKDPLARSARIPSRIRNRLDGGLKSRDVVCEPAPATFTETPSGISHASSAELRAGCEADLATTSPWQRIPTDLRDVAARRGLTSARVSIEAWARQYGWPMSPPVGFILIVPGTRWGTWADRRVTSSSKVRSLRSFSSIQARGGTGRTAPWPRCWRSASFPMVATRRAVSSRARASRLCRRR